jgi:hypothetical protein
MTYKIDDGIPLPAWGKYPFKSMAIGQSFFTTNYAVRFSVAQTHKRFGSRFSIRRDGNGWRVWRVE